MMTAMCAARNILGASTTSGPSIPNLSITKKNRKYKKFRPTKNSGVRPTRNRRSSHDPGARYTPQRDQLLR